MLQLLRNLFSTREGTRTVVVIDDDGTKPSSSHRLNPVSLWFACIAVIIAVIISVVVLLRYTPLGGVVYNQKEIRNAVIAIQQKVAALQDTVEARNVELNEMQRVIRTGKDTTLTPSPAVPAQSDDTNRVRSTSVPVPMRHYEVQRLPADAALISNLFSEAPEFPAPYPIEGTSTRSFNMSNSHYGLDIAATNSSPFKVVADGVIISQEWTFNYGYVIVVQHAEGVISIYKHAQTIEKATGETVQRGDILGNIGDVGILSSGPHLHIEIWKSGIPQNPLNYLVKSQ